MKRRIFAAVAISDAARTKTAEYMEKLRDEFPQIRVGWEKPEKLHLTLKFFGDVEESKLPDLIEAADQTSRRLAKFNLQIAGTGVFPAMRQPKILWLGVRDEKGSLIEANKILENHCKQFGFAREERVFSPHLTIGRLREPNKSIKIAHNHAQNEFSTDGFSAREIIIFESRLAQNGSVYAPLHCALFHEP